MKQLLKILVFSVSILISSVVFNSNKLQSQSFNVNQIDTTEFPKVKAFFTLRNDSYQKYPNIVKSDFTIKKNGQEIPFDYTCSLLGTRPAVSLSLMLDASTSMSQQVSPTEFRYQWASHAANVFVDSLKFTPGTGFQLISFAGRIVESTEWTETYLKAKSDLNLYQANQTGATNLNRPFWESVTGSLDKLIQRPKNSRRIAVMLTDGGHEAGQGQPFMRNEIIKKAQDNNIEVYIILLNAASNVGYELEDVAFETGGKLFRPNTKEDLNRAFFDIYKEIQNNFTCRLEWNEENICEGEDLNREVEITFNRTNPKLTQKVNYTLPSTAVSKLNISQNKFYFSDGVGGSISQDITLTAINGNFHLKEFTLSPNNGSFNIDWKGKSPKDVGGLVLTKDVPKIITINYVEKSSLEELAYKLDLVDEKCPIPSIELVAPCGGITTDVNFTNLPLVKQDLILKDIFYNNSNKDVIVKVNKINDVNDELTLTGGLNYTVYPKSYLALNVEFNPKDANSKEIKLEFSTISGCSTPIAKFTASIGSINVFATPLNFDKIRVKTPKSGIIKVVNESDFTVKINDYLLNGNIFNLIDKTPKSISPKSEIELNLNYISNVEGDFIEKLVMNGVIVEQGNEPITIETQISAYSFLPNLTTVNEINFPNTDKGNVSSPIIIELKNNSIFGDLSIENISFRNNSGDFKLLNNPNLGNSILEKDSKRELELVFQPTKNGYQEVFIDIFADNVEGPEPVSNIITTIKVTGNTNTLDDLFFEDIDFGNQFTCSFPSRSVTVDNTNGNKNIAYSVIRNNKQNHFTINEIENKTILAGQSETFDIVYTPVLEGIHSENIVIRYDDGREGSFTISGKSSKRKDKVSKFDLKQQFVIPGKNITTDFSTSLDIPEFGNIKLITYTLRFDRKSLGMLVNSFNSDLSDNEWSWTVDKSEQNKGVIFISGKSNNNNLSIPTKINNSISFTGFLGEEESSEVIIETVLDNNCLEAETDTMAVKLDGCFIGGRVINVNQFELKNINPSPIVTDTEISYSIGFDCNVELNIMSIMGGVVKQLVNENKKAGEHKVDLKINDLSRGIYFINIKAGPFEKTQKVIVN